MRSWYDSDKEAREQLYWLCISNFKLSPSNEFTGSEICSWTKWREKHLHIYGHLIVERTEGTTISGIEQHAPEQRTSYIIGNKTKKMYWYIYSAIPILFATEKRWKKKTHTRRLVHWPLQEGKLHGGRLLPSLRLHNSIARHTQEPSEEEPILVFWALKKPLPTIISTPARAKCQLRLQKSKNLKMAGQPCVPKASTITPLS
jgi:hypothetical protein